MSKEYKISKHNCMPRTYYRRDVASRAFMQYVYELISAQGGLDTAWGHKIHADCQQVADDVASGTMLDFSTTIGPSKYYVTINSINL